MHKLKQLPLLMVFVTLAQQRSFTRCATELGLSKSAVSQQIRQLEDSLGLRLFNRTTRGVALTTAGEKLLARAQLLKDQTEQLFTDISLAEHQPQGRFAITYPHALEDAVVVPAIAQLCSEFPGLEPVLVADDSSLDLIDRRLDMAVHAGELKDSSHRAQRLGSMTEIFCASPLYIHRCGSPETFSELSQQPWIAAPWQADKQWLRPQPKAPAQALVLKRFASCTSLPSAIALARQHMGMLLLPDAAAQPLLKSGDLVQLLPQVSGPDWPVYSLHAYQQSKPPHLQRFQQLLGYFFSYR